MFFKLQETFRKSFYKPQAVDYSGGFLSKQFLMPIKQRQITF